MTIDQLDQFAKISVGVLLTGAVVIPVWLILMPPRSLRIKSNLLSALLGIGISFFLGLAYVSLVAKPVFAGFHRENPGWIIEGPWVALLFGHFRLTLFLSIVATCLSLDFRSRKRIEA